MKKYLKKSIKILLVIILMFFSLNTVHAELGDYTVLTPLPGTATCDAAGKCTTNLGTYLPNMFNLIIGVAAGLAFIMITVGGITYATTDAMTTKSQGKEMVTNAIIGLLLVIGAYAILYTINPKILDFTIGITEPVIQNNASLTTIPNDNGMCPTCAKLSFSPKMVSAAFAPKMEALNKALEFRNPPVAWSITEGWPPVPGLHVDPCHATGDCVDAVVIPKTGAGINALLSAAKSVGLSAKWEVQTPAEKSVLVNGNPPVPASDIMVNAGIPGVSKGATGQHAHIK